MLETRLLQTLFHAAGTVGFHNFKSQNFKLSVSNPKSKHVAYVSVLSQISNCHSLGRKNKLEILKTDRISIVIDTTSNTIIHIIIFIIVSCIIIIIIIIIRSQPPPGPLARARSSSGSSSSSSSSSSS